VKLDGSLVAPFVAIGALAAAFAFPHAGLVLAFAGAALIAAVLAAVHHAEVVAHRIGEPFGTLVLALSVASIEVSLIVSLMIAGGEATLARDTVYATVMIICTGLLGLCAFAGTWLHREQAFRVDGVLPALAALTTLSVIVLVLPDFTTSSPVATYTDSQLVFVGFVSLALWSVFIFFQTVRHRDYFLPAAHAEEESSHAAPPTTARAWASFALLLVSLVAVVGLAKSLSPSIEAGVAAVGAPPAVIGVAIALLVLLPETVAALRAALADRVQTSLNLALGSGLATIGITIPAVVAASIAFDLPLVLGLAPRDVVLLAISLVVAMLGLTTGRTNLLQGAVQLVLFAAFLFLSFVP
jgi:Ca2+:H+ antiporter